MSPDSEKILDMSAQFGERYAQVEAWSVPASDRYPDGVKYSMQYGNTAGETIVRYDNFPDHPGAAQHHKHTVGGGVEDVDFDDLGALFERFKREVNAHGDEW